MRVTAKTFLNLAVSKHGSKYNYNKVQYKKEIEPVKIKCPEHGWFEQTPRQHLKGSGCPRCSGTGKLNATLFASRAHEVHGNKYDYSKVTYTKSAAKVTIRCRKHGLFQQEANAHLGGQGCPTCAFDSKMKWRQKQETIQGVLFTCQGYELFAVHWILSNTKTKATALKFATVDKPVFEYVLGSKTHRYYPDFFIAKDKRVIEVKSLYTAGIQRNKNGYLNMLKAKRQAVIDAGYKFVLLVMDAKGSRIKLPANWHTLSRQQLFNSI